MQNHILLGDQINHQHQQELLREAEAIRLAKSVRQNNRRSEHRTITPIRRAAYLVTTFIR
jgi:hypothetical protein